MPILQHFEALKCVEHLGREGTKKKKKKKKKKNCNDLAGFSLVQSFLHLYYSGGGDREQPVVCWSLKQIPASQLSLYQWCPLAHRS